MIILNDVMMKTLINLAEVSKNPAHSITLWFHHFFYKFELLGSCVFHFCKKKCNPENPWRVISLNTTYIPLLEIMPQFQIHFLPQAGVICLQFMDRNVLLGTQGLDNRWIITVNCQEARDELLRTGLALFNKKISLRRHDDIMSEEYGVSEL